MSAPALPETPMPEGLTTLLKSAARSLVNACAAPGQTGPQRVEALTGYSAGQISKWQSEADPTLMPVHVVAQLEAATGCPVFTRALASLSGHHVVPAAMGQGSDFDLMQAVTRLTAHHSRFATQACEALEDGKLSRGEMKQLLATLLAKQEETGRIALLLAEKVGG